MFKFLETIFSLGIVPTIDYQFLTAQAQARSQMHIDSVWNIGGQMVYHIVNGPKEWTEYPRYAPHVSESGWGRELVEYTPPFQYLDTVIMHYGYIPDAQTLAEDWNEQNASTY